MCVSAALTAAALVYGAYQDRSNKRRQGRAEDRAERKEAAIRAGSPEVRQQQIEERRRLTRSRAAGGFGAAATNMTGAGGLVGGGRGARQLLGG